MARLLPLILALLLCACAAPRLPAQPVPSASVAAEPLTLGAEPSDPGIRPLSTEVEEQAK
jgi:hypothetical protein